jgi:hypothetical protein
VVSGSKSDQGIAVGLAGSELLFEVVVDRLGGRHCLAGSRLGGVFSTDDGFG